MFAGLAGNESWNFLLAKSFEEAGDPGCPWEQDSTFLLSRGVRSGLLGPLCSYAQPCPREKRTEQPGDPGQVMSFFLHLSFPLCKMGMKKTYYQSLGLLVIRVNSCQVLSMEPGTQKALHITCCYNCYFYHSSPPILQIKNCKVSGCGSHPCP